MAKPEYRLGNIEIDESKFEYLGTDPSGSPHKFLVVGNGNSIQVYVGPKGHVGIVKNNGLNSSRVLGGGSIYINREGDLVLNHLSHIYGAVPSEVVCELARLIQKELKKKSLNGKKAIVNPKKDLSQRWELYGYEEEKGLGAKVNPKR